MKTILVTGAAGFIGFNTISRLLNRGDRIIGVDNINDYYDVSLKNARLELLKQNPAFSFYKANIEDADAMNAIFKEHRFDAVIHLAAQAGVRYSLKNPHAYIQSNIVGFTNILEACRHSKTGHLVYASSSSVYGANKKLPFSEHDNVDHPVALYAATKKSNELMAHAYSSLFGIPTTGLRFFTVYGPWGRPDKALFLFTKAILEGKPIDVFNHGKMIRDFTYIDDIVEGVVRVVDTVPAPDNNWNPVSPDPASSYAPYRVYNIGNNSPVHLNVFIEAIENKLGRKAVKNMMPLQDGDVPETYADTAALEDAVGFRPRTSVQDGINRFVDWYRKYYNV